MSHLRLAYKNLKFEVFDVILLTNRRLLMSKLKLDIILFFFCEKEKQTCKLNGRCFSQSIYCKVQDFLNNNNNNKRKSILAHMGYSKCNPAQHETTDALVTRKKSIKRKINSFFFKVCLFKFYTVEESKRGLKL